MASTYNYSMNTDDKTCSMIFFNVCVCIWGILIFVLAQSCEVFWCVWHKTEVIWCVFWHKTVRYFDVCVGTKFYSMKLFAVLAQNTMRYFDVCFGAKPTAWSILMCVLTKTEVFWHMDWHNTVCMKYSDVHVCKH